jgi:hypothetical protein
MVDDFVAVPPQFFAQPLFQREASVVGANGDFHEETALF